MNKKPIKKCNDQNFPTKKKDVQGKFMFTLKPHLISFITWKGKLEIAKHLAKDYP